MESRNVDICPLTGPEEAEEGVEGKWGESLKKPRAGMIGTWPVYQNLVWVFSVEPMPFSALEDIKVKCQTLSLNSDSLESSDSIMWGKPQFG